MYAFFCFRFGLCNVWHKHNELQNLKSCNYLRLWFTFTSKYQSIEIVFTQVFLDFWQCCTIAVQWKKRMTKLTAHIKEILHCSIFSFILIQSGRHWIGVWESATVSLYFFSIGMITTHIRTQQINIHVILLSPPPHPIYGLVNPCQHTLWHSATTFMAHSSWWEGAGGASRCHLSP